MGQKPDFLAVGPEKTGTTYLHVLLNTHPDVFVTPIKELRFWLEGDMLQEHRLWKVFFAKHWHYRYMRGDIKRAVTWALQDTLKRRRSGRAILKELGWKSRYWFGKHNLKWYGNLFPENGPISGDITPLYYHLSAKRIQEIAAYNPQMKIILFVRDPLERPWSKAKMVLLRLQEKDANAFDIEEFKSYAQKTLLREWRFYMDSIHLWKRHFEHVHVGFYEQLVRDPKTWIKEITDFLEVPELKSDMLGKSINKGLGFDIPEPCEAVLFDYFGKDLLDVGTHFGNEDWITRYDDLCSRYGPPNQKSSPLDNAPLR